MVNMEDTNCERHAVTLDSMGTCDDCTAEYRTTNRHTYWVSIGRNTNDGGQLHTGNWVAFRASVNSVLHGFGEVLAEVNGESEWNGQGEETYLVLAEIHPNAIDDVRSALAILANDFSQDAIGFVGGPGSSLITP